MDILGLDLKSDDYLTGVRLVIQYIRLGLPYWTRTDFIINWTWIDWMDEPSWINEMLLEKYELFLELSVKGYLRCKTSFCNKIAPDV